MNEIEVLSAKAQTFLRSAEQVLSSGDCDSCASRCYYAMFLMAEASPLTQRLTSSSHKGVISLFGEHFVKTGILESHMGNTLNYAYRKRIVGDYGMGASVPHEEAEELLEAARDFVQKVRNYLDQWAQKEGRQ